MLEVTIKLNNKNIFLPEKIPFERYNAYHLMYFIAPDSIGKHIAVAANISGQINLWIYTPDGFPRRLTPFTERRAFPVAWDSGGDKILFMSDYKGNELRQIYSYSLKDGWFTKVIYEEDVTHFISHELWSPDEKKFVFVANKDKKDRLDVYLKDLVTGKIEKLCDGPGGAYVDANWNKETNKIIVENFADPDTIELYLLDPNTKELKRLSPPEEETSFYYGCQYKRGFFMTTNYQREFLALAYYDLDKKEFNIIKEADWDIEKVAYNNGMLLYAVNEDGFSKLYLRDLASGSEKFINGVEGMIWEIYPFGKDKFAYTLTWYKHPLEVFVLDPSNGIKINKVTDMAYSYIPEEFLSKPEVLKYPSFDNRQISALLYKPKANGKRPILVLLHGGPEGQSRPMYDAFIQYLVHRGIVVVEPNFRGSSGYGRTFQKLIRRDWAGGELKDVEYLIKYLQKQDWADTSRIAVMGGSFGGFLTLACVSMIPDYWKCGIDFFGPSNLITLIETAPPFWRGMVLKLIGDPDNPEDKKMLEERSPISHVHNVMCPMMIVQGAQDFRVKKSESDQIVESLKKRGIDVKYIVFEDEGHGFTKEKNRRTAYESSIEFLLEHL